MDQLGKLQLQGMMLGNFTLLQSSGGSLQS